MTQRLFDLAFSAIALALLFPMLLPIVLILRFTGEGEVLFRQTRIGRDGRSFQLYKFATMLKNSPNMGTGTVTLRDDPRILPVGRLLRRTKINELPQLLNVLRGDMSLVGPRPQTKRCFDAFPSSSRRVIVTVPPGLSGIGSIVFRDEEQLISGSNAATDYYDSVIMPYKGKLEEWYVRNRNVRTYFMLIALTLWVVAFPRSRAVWTVFETLPKPEPQLAAALGA